MRGKKKGGLVGERVCLPHEQMLQGAPSLDLGELIEPKFTEPDLKTMAQSQSPPSASFTSD